MTAAARFFSNRAHGNRPSSGLVTSSTQRACARLSPAAWQTCAIRRACHTGTGTIPANPNRSTSSTASPVCGSTWTTRCPDNPGGGIAASRAVWVIRAHNRGCRCRRSNPSRSRLSAAGGEVPSSGASSAVANSATNGVPSPP